MAISVERSGRSVGGTSYMNQMVTLTNKYPGELINIAVSRGTKQEAVYQQIKHAEEELFILLGYYLKVSVTKL